MRLSLLFGSGLGASILFHSGGSSRSHIKAMLEVGQALAGRGHAVRYAALDDNMRYAKGHPSIRAVGLGHGGVYERTLGELIDFVCSGRVGEEVDQAFVAVMGKWLSEGYRYEYRPLLEHVEQDPPDLMVCDIFANPCMDIAEQRAIPLVIGMQALDFIGIFNAPYISTDGRFGPLTIANMPFGAKLVDTLVIPYLRAKAWAEVGSMINAMRGLVGSASTWSPPGAFHYGVGLANTVFGFEAAQPLPPNVRAIGPILSETPAPLDEALGGFLGTHSHVLFVGLGSIVSLNAPDIEAVLGGALDAMDQGLIDGLVWGLGRTSLGNFPNSTHNFVEDSRFVFLPWAPQQAILHHPSTALFLSHSGLESCFEAMYSRTAVLTLPFLGDQAKNARKLYEFGVAEPIDPRSIDLVAAIRALRSRPHLEAALDRAYALTKSHRKRREEAANYLEDHLAMAQACRPHTPYVPGDNHPPCEIHHLLPVATRMSFVQANRIDVYLFASAAVAVLAACIVILGRFVLSGATAAEEPRLKSD